MISDLRYAFRQLAKSPVFTAVAVLTLALGIGISTTIFNCVNPLLFRSLPFRDTEMLVDLNECNLKQGFERLNVSYADFSHWKNENQVFADLGIWDTNNLVLSGGDEPERIEGCTVSARLFATLGLEPALGRGFSSSEDQPGANAVVLLSDALWRRRFAADPQIIGQTVTLNGKTHTIIGVMPSRVRFPNESDLWTPLVVNQPEKTHGNFSYGGVARLKPGITLAQAKADLEAIHERIAEETPMTNAHVEPIVRPIDSAFLDGDLRTMGWIMLGAVAFVLAVASSNVASLLLAQSLGRHKEFAIRQALGAGRWRTIRQLLVESLVLGAVGGGLGFIFSLWGLDLVKLMVPVDIPYWINFSRDTRVIGFAIGTTFVTSILFGLAPAWQATRINVQAGLAETTRSASGSRQRQRLRSLLVVSEVALATLLLCGTGLMIRSLINLQRVNPGFNPDRLAMFSLDLNSKPGTTSSARIEFFERLTERLRALPGVQTAAACSRLPLTGRNTGQVFVIEGQPPSTTGVNPVGNLRVVTPGYFATMEIPLIKGRDFSAADTATSTKTIVIDAAFARKYFGDANPIGQHILWNATDPATRREIVGIAADVKHSGLDRETRPGFYVPHSQNARSRMEIVLRTTTRDPLTIVPVARQILRELDPSLPLFNANSMIAVIGESYWIRLFLGKLMVGFAILAVALAALGIASVVAFSVMQRTQEIGVRMALGAQPHNVLQLILGQGMKLVLLGLGLGLVASVGLSRLLTSQLFGVSAADPLTLVASAVVFAAVSLLACWIPARHATRINPVEALRAE